MTETEQERLRLLRLEGYRQISHGTARYLPDEANGYYRVVHRISQHLGVSDSMIQEDLDNTEVDLDRHGLTVRAVLWFYLVSPHDDLQCLHFYRY